MKTELNNLSPGYKYKKGNVSSGSQDILLKLDGLLGNISMLLEKMRKTESHVEKVKNTTLYKLK